MNTIDDSTVQTFVASLNQWREDNPRDLNEWNESILVHPIYELIADDDATDLRTANGSVIVLKDGREITFREELGEWHFGPYLIRNNHL